MSSSSQKLTLLTIVRRLADHQALLAQAKAELSAGKIRRGLLSQQTTASLQRALRIGLRPARVRPARLRSARS
jgi:hypothetical protein